MNLIKSEIVEIRNENIVEKGELRDECSKNIIDKEIKPIFKDRWNIKKDICKSVGTENVEIKKEEGRSSQINQKYKDNLNNFQDNFEERFINQKEKDKDKEIRKEDTEINCRSFHNASRTGDEVTSINVNCHTDFEIRQDFVQNQAVNKYPLANFDINRTSSEFKVGNTQIIPEERKITPEIRGVLSAVVADQNIDSENFDINRLIEMNMNAYQELNVLEQSVGIIIQFCSLFYFSFSWFVFFYFLTQISIYRKFLLSLS